MERKPIMGFNTWNVFGENINEELIMQTADALISTGLADAGYKYVIIDDCWSLRERDENGNIVADPKKFPHGMRYLADYIHSKGLKFGMYSCVGDKTCAGYPGSCDHEFQDAKLFNEFGIDYLKYDYCYIPGFVKGKGRIRKMGLALARENPDIVFAACTWGSDDTKSWISETYAKTWRSTGDIWDNWKGTRHCIRQQLEMGLINYLGCFNDMDMLTVGQGGVGNVGKGGSTFEEYKTLMSFYALCGSPLIMGSDVRSMSKEYIDMLSNKELIALNQDTTTAKPFSLSDAENPIGAYAIAKFLANGEIAVGLFNLTDHEVEITPTISDTGIEYETKVTYTDVWTKESFEVIADKFTAKVKAHECKLYVVKF